MNDDQLPDDLLARVLAGEATAEETAAAESWAARSPRHRAELDRLRLAWRTRGGPTWDVDSAWRRFGLQLGEREAPAPVVALRPRGRATRIAWRIAAAVVVLLGAVFAWRAIGGDRAIAYATGPGERRALTLDDGTEVVLAPRSSLAVARGFGKPLRVLHLEGEAWFTVAHDADHPFSVITGGHVVRDIGTVFTVRSRHPDSVTVVVVDGAVAVRGADSSTEMRLAAGDVAAFGDGAPMVRHAQPADALAGWHDGTLQFTGVPAARVAARLGEWFGVSILITDSTAAKRPISVTFAGRSLDDAIDVLSLLLGASVERHDSLVMLR